MFASGVMPKVTFSDVKSNKKNTFHESTISAKSKTLSLYAQ